ncbi:MAG: hypothetical protein LBP54_00470 [Campylobacteraceae bacterium]|jgi:hypothetical protein|nr:hypothetical protein [Campylobacteraceae bacterium]
MKKMVILAMFIGFLSAENIEGFRDIRWGEGIEKLDNYTIIYDNKTSKVITAIKNDEKLVIGDANISEVEYYFFDNALYAVNVKYSNAANNDIIMQTVEKKYGLDYKNNKIHSSYKDGYKIQGDKITENIEYYSYPNPNSPTTWDVYKRNSAIMSKCDYAYTCKMELVNRKILQKAADYAKKIRKIIENEAKKSIDKGLNDL